MKFIVGWEPLLALSHVFQLFHVRLVHFKNKGEVAGPGIGYVESSGHEAKRDSKRQRKDDRKQELTDITLRQIQQAHAREPCVIYTDGSAEFVEGVSRIAGFGCHEPGLWEQAHHLPVN